MSEITELQALFLGQDARLSDQDARLSRLEKNSDSQAAAEPASASATSFDEDSTYGVSEPILPLLGFSLDVLKSLQESTELTDEFVVDLLKYLCDKLGAQSMHDLRRLTAEDVEGALMLVPKLERKPLAGFLNGWSHAASEEGMFISDWPRLRKLLCEDELGRLVELCESLGIKKVADLKMAEDQHFEELVNVATEPV